VSGGENEIIRRLEDRMTLEHRDPRELKPHPRKRDELPGDYLQMRSAGARTKR